MSVGVNKSGVVNAGSFVETNGAMLNTFMSEEYTPTASVENSCMERTITGFVVDKEYYIDMDIVWSGFTTDAASNFGMLAQGSVYNGSNWSWNYGNPMASKIGNLTSLMLSSNSGTKHFKVKFTAEQPGYELGCRADYSNCKGTITYKNIRVVPADSFVDGAINSGRILVNSIAMDNFIEN